MTVSEFHAWLDGYSYSIDRAPTETQWQVIKEHIAQIKPPVPSVQRSNPFQNFPGSAWYAPGPNLSASAAQQQIIDDHLHFDQGK